MRKTNIKTQATEMTKRVAAAVLAMIMIMGGSVIPKASVSAASRTQAQAIEWVRSQMGKRIDYDGVYGAQCVDLIKAYYAYLGVSPVTGNGKDYARNALPAGWGRYKGAAPQKGDILVYGASRGNQYGHVAIFESERVTYHQNFAGKGYVTKVTYRYNGLTNPYWGVIRPNWSSVSASNVTFSNQSVKSTTTNNAIVYTRINNPGRQRFSRVGCDLYNASGQQIHSYFENCSLSTSYVNYTCNFNTDMKKTLSAGTTYKYVLYAVINGRTYRDSQRTFTTKGQQISFSDQRVDFVQEKNAQVYVKINNPGRQKFTRVGCRLYNSAGQLVKSYTEDCALSTSYVNYTCNFNSDAHYTLNSKTTYKYELFAEVAGNTYTDELRSFTTK